MTLDEAIDFSENEAKRIERKSCSEWVQELQIKESANRFRQLAEWLRELKAYRGLIENADKLIESEYGVVIIEGYADVLSQMKEIYEEVKADDGK